MEEQLERYSKNLEKTVKEQTKKLEEAERLAIIGQTAGMVGHDIRNPLQAIISATYLVKEDLTCLQQNEIKQSLIESMKEIEEQTSYINKIVSDLQDYSKRLSPLIEEIDLKQLLENLLISTETDENVTMTSEIKDDVKKVKVDPDYLKRILTNLITNAEQAMPNGGKITITATKEKDTCIITVEDSGEGIPEDIKSKIFTPLFTTKSKGQGFGLAVSKRLAKAMGGDINFESEKGNGSKFKVILPLC